MCGAVLEGDPAMESNGRLNALQLKTLAEELASLNKEQDEARQTEIYIPMTSQQYETFATRTQRISRIYAILSEPENWANGFLVLKTSPFVTASQPLQ